MAAPLRNVFACAIANLRRVSSHRILASHRDCYQHLYRCPAQTSTNFVKDYSSATSELDDDVEDTLYRLIYLKMMSHDRVVMQSYEEFLKAAAKELDVDIAHVSSPSKAVHERMSLLRSVHIYRKCMVQYETRTYSKIVRLKYLTGSTAATYLEYVQRNLPEGVSMEVEKYQIVDLPEHIKSAPSPT